MRPVKLTAAVVLLFTVAACGPPPPLGQTLMLPSGAVYDQIDSNNSLKGTIIVEEVAYAAKNERAAPLYTEASTSLALALQQAGYLAADEKSAKYGLSATIKDVDFPSCMFGSCETGSAIHYVMRDIKRDKIVYDELLVVPHTGEYPLFGANMQLVVRAMLGGAIGENYAHLLQVLSRKTRADFK